MSLFIVDYTEKAIAVFGDSKSYKNKLMEIGGKFNPSLNYENDKKAGYIFPKSKRSLVEQLIKDVNDGKIEKEASLSYKGTSKDMIPQTTERKEYSSCSSSGSLSLNQIKDELLTHFVPKKDFMNLVSKIERLEQEIAILKDLKLLDKSKTSSSSSSSSSSKYNGMIQLSNWADAEEEDDYEEEKQIVTTKSLLRGKK